MLAFLAYASIQEVGGQENSLYRQGTLLTIASDGTSGNYTLNPFAYRHYLPSGLGAGSVLGTIITAFTDIFSTILNWVGAFAAYMVQFFMTPYNLISSMNMPQQVTYAVGSMWYLVMLISIIVFMFGRD